MKQLGGLLFGSALFFVLLVVQLPAVDLGLNSAGTPYAPLDAPKKADTLVGPLSSEDRQDLIREFKGLLALGLQPASYEHWDGRSMADCAAPEGRSEHWNYRCEIITGQCNGFYYFYPSETRRAATLQQMEVKVHASESQLMDDFRVSLRKLFGRERLLEPDAARLPAVGSVRHWTTQQDNAYLFMDISENPAGMVRFVWKRAPLIAGDQARADFKTGS